MGGSSSDDLFWRHTLLVTNISSLLILVVLYISIALLRRSHAHHVHTLWYIFFLTTCLYTVVLLYLYATASHLLDASLLEAVRSTLVDSKGELYLVGTIIFLGIVPQILSFVVSGILGADRPPFGSQR